ncbi:MAG: hypothetical protein ACYC5A_09130 [Thermoleophilia bacterium]
MWVMPLAAALAAALLSGILLRYCLAARSPSLLAWSVALMLLGIAAACAFVGSFDAWTALTAKAYYLAAALFTAYMGLGAVYYNLPRIIGHVWQAVLLLAAAVATYLLAGAEVDRPALAGSAEPGWQAIDTGGFTSGTVIALGNVGLAILVAAAVYALVQRRAALAQAAIAAGVLLVALAGSLGRVDAWEWAFIAQLPGMAVIFAGAMLAVRTGQSAPGQARQ